MIVYARHSFSTARAYWGTHNSSASSIPDKWNFEAEWTICGLGAAGDAKYATFHIKKRMYRSHLRIFILLQGKTGHLMNEVPFPIPCKPFFFDLPALAFRNLEGRTAFDGKYRQTLNIKLRGNQNFLIHLRTQWNQRRCFLHIKLVDEVCQ